MIGINILLIAPACIIAWQMLSSPGRRFIKFEVFSGNLRSYTVRFIRL